MLQLEPKNVQGYIELARIYLDQGQYEAASEAYGKGIAINPDAPELRFELGVVRAKQEDHSAACGGAVHYSIAIVERQ